MAEPSIPKSAPHDIEPPLQVRNVQEGNIPIPDPSILTTEALKREIYHLRELLEQKMEETNTRYQQRFEAQTKALDAAFLAQQTAVQAALSAAEKGVQTAMVSSEKAVTKAENAAEKRFDAIAEFRAAFSDLVNQQMPRKEAETRLGSITEKVDSRLADFNLKLDELRGFSSKAFLVAGISLVISSISMFVTLISFLNLN